MSLFDDIRQRLGGTNSDAIGKAVEEMVDQAVLRRKGHERRWYDNNFFDDGYHFRIISKKTGKVIDHMDTKSGYVERAIPRASRQIRGVSNLLFAAEPYPVVYPKRISVEQFRDKATQQINQQAYQQEMEKAKDIARKQGIWLSTEWEDNQELSVKLINMILKAAKNSVAWMQVYTKNGKIVTEVYDAFDIICFGDKEDEKELPFITKACSMDIEEIMTSPLFEESKVAKLKPDNKYATSEVKDAYMRSRFGNKSEAKRPSIIVKETFLKEYLSDENWKQAIKLGEKNGALEGKSKGDMIMRHPFSAGGVTLADEYVDYDEYPLIPFRFEPGPLYQVPFIERFIPQNKSLDIIVTRLEKFVNAMVVGVYQKRKNENYQISNFPGGQFIEYETTPATQMNLSSPGAAPFQILELMDKYIDEQGATTAGGVNIPAGVKSGVAIESVKSTEYANLKIPTLMLKKTIKHIAERMLERADKDYLEPVEVSSLEDGEPMYFDVVGQRRLSMPDAVNQGLPPDVVPLSRKTKVRIEIEPGLGLTMEGKRQAMDTIIEKVLSFMKAMPGSIPPEAFQMMVKRFLEQFGWGATQELMEAMEQGMTTQQMTEEQITQMKIAIIEALKDSGAVGPEMEQRLVDSTKVGVLEAMKDSGMMDKAPNGQAQAPKGPSESISFKDLPPDGQSQMAAQAGIHLHPQILADHQAQQDAKAQQQSAQDLALKQQEMKLKEKALTQRGGKNGSLQPKPAR